MKYAIITTEFFNIEPKQPIPLGSLVMYRVNSLDDNWSITYQGMRWTYSHYAKNTFSGTLIKSYITFIDENNRLTKLIFNLNERNVLI